MKKFLFASLLISFSIVAQTSNCFAQAHGTLNIQVRGLKNNRGSVGLRIYKNAEAYKSDKVYKEYIIDPANLKASISISQLPYGTYSISVAHDENFNKKFDKNILGIPTESFGFSNNPKIYFGPPTFDQIKFTVKNPKTTIPIKLQKLL